jgi:UDP-N-acetylmuramoyl-tripeptide--D-alanyl-D-alanine ligase
VSGNVGSNRASFSLEEIRTATGASGPGDITVTGVTTDSRAIEAGNLFIALVGERFDGHQYIPQAISDGVAAVLGSSQIIGVELAAEVPVLTVPDTLIALGDLARFHRRRFAVPVVGITGSYGKTTTRALTAAALGAGFNIHTSKGNFNNEIGLPLTLLQLEAGHEAAVVEMGMRGLGQIEYLARIAEPTVGIVTNVGPQHIELLGSVENIAQAKGELIQHLPEDGLAILPADSPSLEYLKSRAKCRVVTFGVNEGADYRVTQVQTQPAGLIAFQINMPAGEAVPIRLPLPGAHNAVNAAAALAAAVELGVPATNAARALEAVEVPGARMRVVNLEDGTVIIDDCYNAGPDSMRAALQTLLDYPGSGRRVAILGAMRELGPHSETQHAAIGRFAGQFVEQLVGVDGDTRPLLNAAVAAAREVENELAVSYCDAATEAAARVGEWVRPGDVVLVKGSRSIGLEVVVEALKTEASG